MSPAKRSRLGLSLGLGTLLFVVPMGFLVYYLAQGDSRPRRERPHFYEGDGVPDPVRSPLASKEPTTAEVPARRELPISLHVFAPDGSPHAGLEVSLDGVAFEENDGGVYLLPPAQRPRCSRLVVRIGERELAFDELVSGDPDDSGCVPSAALLPQYLRWTLHFLAGDRTSGDLWIAQEVLLVEDWVEGARVRVRGTTNLPDGAHVQTSLELDGYRVASGQSPPSILGGAWESIASVPSDASLFSGWHDSVAGFSEIVEDPSDVEVWREALPDVAQAALSRPIESRVRVFVGSRDAARREDAEAARFYAESLRLARRRHGGLLSRVREIEHYGRGWNPALLASLDRAREQWFRESYLDEEGVLDVPRWRQFLDVEWRPALESQIESLRTRGVQKYPAAFSRLETLLDSILQMSRAYSLFVIYPLFQLEPHANDFYLDERGRDDLVLLEQLVDEQFELLDRFVAGLKRGEASSGIPRDGESR